MTEPKKDPTVSIRMSWDEHDKLERVRADNGLRSLNAAVRLLINQAHAPRGKK